VKSAPSQAVVVATTHLLYNPRRSDVRLAQVQLLLAEIDRLAYNRDTLS
jgi:protein angel